jgi:hypothetical protein
MVSSDWRGERGQLLLVGGIVLGVVVLGSVVLLNDMKFNDTIGSQGNQQALNDAERTRETLRTDLRELAVRVRAETDHANFADAVEENVTRYGRYYSNMTFEDGIVYVNVTFSESASRDGRLLEQTTDGRFWFDASENWTAATDAYFLSPFEVGVEQFPDTTAPHDPNTTVRVTGAEGNVWELRINRSSTDPVDGPAVVAVADGRRVGVERTGPGVVVDVDEGTINGTDEPGFAFRRYVTPPYTAEFENNPNGPGNAFGKHARGTYRIGTDSRYWSESHPDVDVLPAARPAVNVTYQRPELKYDTTIYLNSTGGDP